MDKMSVLKQMEFYFSEVILTKKVNLKLSTEYR